MSNKETGFSVALGLFDYINPILYAITVIAILIKSIGVMPLPLLIVFIIGMTLSLMFGFSIPTIKLLVGLGKMEFKMPVNLVLLVNLGILLSGLALFKYISNIDFVIFIILLFIILAVLGVVIYKTKKFNTVAVLIGAAGYILLYTSLITLAISKGMVKPIIMYAIAILLFIFLCGVGIKADLKNPKTHWVIEISNVVCQALVAIATVIQFL